MAMPNDNFSENISKELSISTFIKLLVGFVGLVGSIVTVTVFIVEYKVRWYLTAISLLLALVLLLVFYCYRIFSLLKKLTTEYEAVKSKHKALAGQHEERMFELNQVKKLVKILEFNIYGILTAQTKGEQQRIAAILEQTRRTLDE